MYKIILRILLLIAIVICTSEIGNAQYTRSIKVVFTNDFDTLFENGGEWYGVNQTAVEGLILGRMVTDFYPQGISVSTTSGNMTVYIGGSADHFGSAETGVGSFVDASGAYAEIYSTYFSTFGDWQGGNATVARIGEALAGTASHEAAHLLNCRHAYASYSFDPGISNQRYPNDFYVEELRNMPKEPEQLVGTTGDDDPLKYRHLMATRGWLTLGQRATEDRFFTNISNFVTDFGTSGGTTVSQNMSWGIVSKTWTQSNNITVNSGKTLLIGAHNYTHSLNNKYIKATGTGKLILHNGLSGSYWKVTNSDNTVLYGLYPDSATANANYTSVQAVRNSSDTMIYPTAVPTAPTTLSISGSIGQNPYLSWSGSTGVIGEYRIYRREAGGQWGYHDYSTTTYYTDPDVTIEDESEEDVEEFEYQVKAWNARGESSASPTRSIYGIAEWKMPADTNIPRTFALDDNYPNPFNPVTTIRYQLPEAANVTLVVFNIMGQEVARLVDTAKQAGYHTVKWDATQFASGTYIYKITAGSFTATKRMVVIK